MANAQTFRKDTTPRFDFFIINADSKAEMLKTSIDEDWKWIIE